MPVETAAELFPGTPASADGGARERKFFHARRRAMYGRALSHGALGIAPLISTAILFRLYAQTHGLALDFESGPWLAAHDILRGATPYIDPTSPQLATGAPFVYPAAAGVLLAPFGLLPQASAGWIFALLCIGSVLGTLAVLGIRDWRVYGAVLLWPAVITGWEWANLSVPLALGVALCWRYRERPVVAGLLLALVVSVKVYVWPLALWMLATRRLKAVGWAVVGGLAINVSAWAIVGFGELSRYADLMHALTRAQQRAGYSLIALALNNGASVPLAYALGAVAAVAVAVACVNYGRSGHDSAAYVLGICLSLLSTPVFWLHYFVLLVVILAVARPRLGPLWFLPLAMWVTVTHPHRWPGSLPVVTALMVAGIVTVAGITASAPSRSSAA
jgi:hypothetical protein